MSTLQATTVLPRGLKIVSATIVAYTADNNYLDELTTERFKTIADFNDFFLNNPDYHIHDCNIELGDGTNLRSHDDGEVSIQFASDKTDQTIIDSIFEKYYLDKRLISLLKSKPGYYIAIDKQNNIVGEYKDFDEYLNSTQN